MKLKHRIHENEVIAEFLLAEIRSSRFRERIVTALRDRDLSLVTNPNLRSVPDNEARKQLLSEVRGYGVNKSLFEHFPDDMRWYSAEMYRQALQEVMYIDYCYWNELSGGTRLPTVAAQSIKNGVEIYGVKNTGFQDIHQDYISGKVFPRLIFVARNRESRVVVLEGHARLTAYFLDNDHAPTQLEVIVGFSEKLDNWGLY